MDVVLNLADDGLPISGHPQFLQGESILLGVFLRSFLVPDLRDHDAIDTIQVIENALKIAHLADWDQRVVILALNGDTVLIAGYHVFPLGINLMLLARPTLQLHIVLYLRGTHHIEIHQLLVNLLRKTLIFSIGIHKQAFKL